MAKKMKKILGIAMAAVLCTASVVPALADGTPAPQEENNLTITTTTEVTKEGGNTVTVTIEQWDNKADENAEIAIEGEQMTVETENKKKETTVIDGEETQTEIIEEEKEEETYPDAEVELIPGETTVGEAVTDVTVTDNVAGGSTENNSDITTTTEIERTVTATTGEVEVTVNEVDDGLVGDEASGLVGIAPEYDETDEITYRTDGRISDSSGKDGLFDRNFLSESNADPSKWTDIPPEGEYRYIGTGEHSKYFVGMVKVIYEKDADGNTVYDEDGNPVIEKLVNSVNGSDITSNGEVLDEIPEEWEIDVGFSSSRAQNFMLMDVNGNRVYAYCSDADTGAVKNTWYTVSNLEDSDYYTPEAEEHIRSIAMNGYWGTSDIPDEEGNYKMGSLESIKAKMLAAIENGEIERYVQVPVRDTTTEGAGKIQVDENGDPIYYEEKMDLVEIISGMTEGEALLATQAAIWSFANGSQGATSGVDGDVVVTPDWYRNHQIGYGKVEGEPLDDAAGARVAAIYEWLMNLETEEESTTVINDKNFVEDMSLVVKDKVADHENNADDNDDNDVYNTEVKFNLAFVPDKDSDDLLVYLTDANGEAIKGADGNPIIRRLAGTAKEGETYDAITPEEDGSYVLTGLQLMEGEFTFDLRLEGTQYLEKGVYLYSAVGGREVSQTFVGVAEGERNVDVSTSVTITFDVDENDKVVAERVWHSAASRSKSIGRSNPPAENTTITEEGVPLAASADGLVEILDEEVPLADAPETGDNSIIYVLMSIISLCGIALLMMKKNAVKGN